MKHSILRPLTLAVALSLGVISGAQAAQYTSLDSEASNISFVYSQMNVKMNGSFAELKAKELSFDPAQPEAAKVTIEVVLSSIDAGYGEANEEVAKDEWLALKQYPLATFNSQQVEALGDNNYQISGELSIKGHSQTVSAPFSFKEDGDAGVFTGSFTFKRTDFGIGEGQWKSTGIVADDIEVKFNIVAK